MKKILSSILTFILIITLALPIKTHAEQLFSDVPVTHPNYEEINYLVEKGVLDKGTKFGISNIVTREEVAVMVARAVGLDGNQRATKFTDVQQSNKNSGYIQSAVEAGIIKGYDDGTFKPTDKVTRGHMAAFISRAFDLPTGTKTFKDVPSNHTAYEAVKQLAAAGITTGYNDSTFKPQDNLTRAHISAFLARAMKFSEGDHSGTKPTPPVTSTNKGEMKVHFIDVGQGDSTLIQSHDGKNILVDGGPRSAGNTVVAYLKALGIKKLDYVVATHPDADHVGGLIAVLNSISVGQFVNSGKSHTTETYAQLLKLVETKSIKYSEPKIGEILIGGWTSDFYLQSLYSDAKASDTNDASIVLKTGYKNVEFLLMADASAELEGLLVDSYDSLKVQILKAGHHGSNTSSSSKFINAVHPEVTILSYGKDNSYGHPHTNVLENLKAVNSKLYSTAQDGTIVITTNGDTYSVNAKEFVPPSTVTPKPTPEPTKESYKNCTELRKVYPLGVDSSHPAYEAKHDGDNDGQACEPEKETEPVKPEPTPQPPAKESYKNCTELRKVYPDGVQEGHPAYDKKHDRDGDGYACEK